MVAGRGARVVSTRAADVLEGAGLPARLDREAALGLLLYDGVDSYRPFFAGLSYVPPRCPVRERSDGTLAAEVGRAPRRLDVGLREAERRLRGAVEEAVGDALRAATRPGVFLSGGLDSSIVAVCAAAWWKHAGRAPGDLRFVHLLPRGGPTEVDHARAIAAWVGHDLLEVADRGLDPFGDAGPLLAGMDLPFAGSGAAGFLDAGRMLVDEGVDCVLTGDGGDELFGTYAAGPWSGRGGVVGARRLLRRVSWHLGAQGLPMLRRPQGFGRLSGVAPWLAADEREVPLPAAHPKSRLGLRGEAAWRDRLLRCARQVAIVEAYRGLERAVGIVGRFPLFDPRVEDCAVALPPRAFDGAEEKAIARRAFADLLPPPQRARSKDQPESEPLFREDLRRLGPWWEERYLRKGPVAESGLLRPERVATFAQDGAAGTDATLTAAMNLVAVSSWCEARGVGRSVGEQDRISR